MKKILPRRSGVCGRDGAEEGEGEGEGGHVGLGLVSHQREHDPEIGRAAGRL